VADGESLKQAADLALKHYLQDHEGAGPAGFTIQILNLDNASPSTGGLWDAAIEAENAQRCIEDADCMVYFGPFDSDAAKISLPMTNKAGIAHIGPANTYPGLTHPWDKGEPEAYRPTETVNYFRPNAPDDWQGTAGAAWAACLGVQKVYILDDGQLYGRGIATAFAQKAAEVGLEVVGQESLAEEAEVDFAAVVANIEAAAPNLVYGGLEIDSGGPQVIEQLIAQGLFSVGITFMGPDRLHTPDLLAGIEGITGTMYLTLPGLAGDQLTTEAGRRYFQDFQTNYGVPPTLRSTYAYQAMQIILDAIERAGKKDRAAILEAMRSGTYAGITGPFSFDTNGDPTQAYLAGYMVQAGSPAIFWGPLHPTLNEKCPTPAQETPTAEGAGSIPPPDVPSPAPVEGRTAGGDQSSDEGPQDDPFAYCAAVGTVDAPDERYLGGPDVPEAVIQGLIAQDVLTADMPPEVARQQTVWRCMEQKVMACVVGANLPCTTQADTSQTPTAAMEEYCQDNPLAEAIPASVTGRGTVYAWSCNGVKPEVVTQIFTPDPQGFLAEIWYEIAPPE
jgi:branched-chain amino acid transport system substrate-binding protein